MSVELDRYELPEFSCIAWLTDFEIYLRTFDIVLAVAGRI